MIMYSVDGLCNQALERTQEDWRAKNICPPCTYALEGEKKLRFSILCSMDGNNSLKLVGENYRHGTVLKDERTRRMDVWVGEEEVNKFANDHPVANVSILIFT